MPRPKKQTANQKLLNEMYEAANDLLQNLSDSGQDRNFDTGAMYPDVSRMEKALAEFNKKFKLGKV